MNVSFDFDNVRYYLNKRVSGVKDGFILSHENRDIRVGDVRSINNRLWRVVWVLNMYPSWFSSNAKYAIEWRPVDELPYEKFVESVIEGIKNAYA